MSVDGANAKHGHWTPSLTEHHTRLLDDHVMTADTFYGEWYNTSELQPDGGHAEEAMPEVSTHRQLCSRATAVVLRRTKERARGKAKRYPNHNIDLQI